MLTWSLHQTLCLRTAEFSSVSVVLNSLASTSKTGRKAMSRGQTSGASPHPDNSMALKAKVSVPQPRLHPGAAIRLHTSLQRTASGPDTKARHRPRRGGEESYKSDSGKIYLWAPKKPGHMVTASRSWLGLAKARLHSPELLLFDGNASPNRNNVLSKTILFPKVFLFSLRCFTNAEQ